jgi:hypothetical protein
MYINIIIFFIILLILTLILHHSKNYKEGFFDFPDATHNAYVKSSHKIFNELTNTINLSEPNIPVSPVSAKDMEMAIGVIDANPTSNIYSLKPDNDYPIPDRLPNVIEKAKICEVKPADCSAFDDPEFAKNCGVSFDNKGTNSSGKPHSGGLFISSGDYKAQLDRFNVVKSTGSAPYDPYKVFQPTLGKAKPGTFGVTKSRCLIVKEKVDCEAKQSFNSPNCTQCFTSQDFSRVDPSAQKLPSTLNLFGNGKGYVWTSDTPEKNLITKGGIKLSPNTATVVNIPGNAEGTVFSIIIQPDGGDLTYVAGYLEGKTPRGTFKLDLMNFVRVDQVSNLKPRINGTITANGFRCLVLIPGNGQTYMNLACMMPFTFLNIYDTDALSCDNGPIITKEDSATFLESDPCFGKKNKPGNYVLGCLQARWISLGGTPQGTGYPSNQTKANALQLDGNGNPLALDTIIENMSVKIKQGLTGTDANGIPLSINDWNTVSMWATGVPINTPCDGPNKNSGPLSKDCLSYLYMNKGATTHIGPTYTLSPTSMASMKGQNIPNTYCQPGAPLDPNTPEGMKFAQKLGGINAVKKSYDEINRLANDNSVPNDRRQGAIDQCYGVQLRAQGKQKRTGPTQVFAVSNGGYTTPKDQAQQVCSQYGAQVATTAQLQDAQNKGADWCFTAWVSDSNQAMYPSTTQLMSGCGNGRAGVTTWTPPTNKAGVNCYGPKPGVDDVPSGTILPFNTISWDAPEGAVAKLVTSPAAAAQQTTFNGIFSCLAGQGSGGGNNGIYYAENAGPNMNWTQIPGGLTSLTMAPNGALFGTNSIGQIFILPKYTQKQWVVIPGSLRNVHTDGNILCGTNGSNAAFAGPVSTIISGTWVHLKNGLLKQVATFRNMYYGIGMDNAIWYQTNPNGGWTPTLRGGVFKYLTIDENGVLLLTGTDDELYVSDSGHYTPSQGFRKVQTTPAVMKFRAVSISKGSIYGIDTGGSPWFAKDYRNATFVKITGGGQTIPAHRIP